jgi:hypothetical protein
MQTIQLVSTVPAFNVRVVCCCAVSVLLLLMSLILFMRLLVLYYHLFVALVYMMCVCVSALVDVYTAALSSQTLLCVYVEVSSCLIQVIVLYILYREMSRTVLDFCFDSSYIMGRQTA